MNRVVEINDEMRSRASSLSSAWSEDQLRCMDHTNEIGTLGMQVFQREYPDAIPSDSRAYNFILKGKRISTRTRCGNAPPLDYFEWAVPLIRNVHLIDFFVFLFVFKDKRRGILCGYLSREEFLAKAQRKHKGDLMPQGGMYRSNSHAITLEQLKRWQQ